MQLGVAASNQAQIKFAKNLGILSFPSKFTQIRFQISFAQVWLVCWHASALPTSGYCWHHIHKRTSMARVVAVPVVEGKGRAQRNTCGSSALDAQRALQQALTQASTHAVPVGSAWRATVGWLLLLLVVACAAAAPKHLSDLYLALAVVGLPWRVYSFGRKGWAFFLLDYCYVSYLEGHGFPASSNLAQQADASALTHV